MSTLGCLGTRTDQTFNLVVGLFGLLRGAHQDLVLLRGSITTADSSVIVRVAPLIILVVAAGSGSS